MPFDLDAFVNSTVDAPMDTEYPICPEGEFSFMFDGAPDMLKVENIAGVSQRTGNAYDFNQMTLLMLCQDDKVKADMGRDKVPVRCRVNLDFDQNGRLSTEKGKNVLLGQIRAALDQNGPGWKPSMILGAGPVLGRVRHTTGTDGRKYADVVSVARKR